jgi:DNA invertase Pin-like site-specific DNA recombinase
MRHRIRSPGEPDLFSSALLSEVSSPGLKPRKAPSSTDNTTSASPQYLLPRDLSSGIRQLTDQEFDRLLAAVLAEQKRRGKKVSVSRKASYKPPVQDVGPPLTLAKINAVRAAFKAGVRPSRIARQFGISRADVRKALTRDTSNRSP